MENSNGGGKDSTLIIFIAIVVIALGALGLYIVSNSEPVEDVNEPTDVQDMDEENMNEEEMQNEEDTMENENMQDDESMMDEDLVNIAELATDTENLSTLVTALSAAELVETFTGEEMYTVLAPTDNAFAEVQSTVDTLLEDPSGDLTTVLTYHVIDGKVMSGDLTDGMAVETLAGQVLTVGISEDSVTFTDVNGNVATVTTADVEASNGVVHIIDTVLIPEL